ncbi:hypothetical protein FRC16_010916 [Serendipita sp. 398]|nr:hypothetical protein FRC16_010916 [Serendipita sp. 398]
MTRHSKNNTASSVFSYAEHQKLKQAALYGTQRVLLGSNTHRAYNACSLCLAKAINPVACQKGHLYCKECVVKDLLTQREALARKKAEIEALRKEEEQAREEVRLKARELILAGGSQSLFGKRKEREEDGESQTRLPPLTDIKLQTMCNAAEPPHPLLMKHLIPVSFSFTPNPSSNKSASTSSTTPSDEQTCICPSCQKELSNTTKLTLMKPCHHVICKTCTDKLVKPSSQCIVCDTTLAAKDIIDLVREGTGFASGGRAETSKTGVAFQG